MKALLMSPPMNISTIPIFISFATFFKLNWLAFPYGERHEY